jgi:hypothetical protein
MSIHEWKYPDTPVGRASNPVYVTKIESLTTVMGNCNVNSTFINGEILKVYYDKGTVTATVNAVVSFEGETIDTYDINSGSAHRYPRVATIVCPFVVSGLINVAVSSGQPNKTFDVYIFSR